MLPMAAPISRFRLTMRSFHSNSTMAPPIPRPTTPSHRRVSAKGSMTKQVAPTTMIKRRRTKTISTVNLPRMQVAQLPGKCTRAALAAPAGSAFQIRSACIKGNECTPRPAVRGPAGYVQVTLRVYTAESSLGSTPEHGIVRHTAPFLAARLGGSLRSAPAFRYRETPCLWGATLLHLKDARASVVQQDTLGVCCQ